MQNRFIRILNPIKIDNLKSTRDPENNKSHYSHDNDILELRGFYLPLINFKCRKKKTVFQDLANSFHAKQFSSFNPLNIYYIRFYRIYQTLTENHPFGLPTRSGNRQSIQTAQTKHRSSKCITNKKKIRNKNSPVTNVYNQNPNPDKSIFKK